MARWLASLPRPGDKHSIINQPLKLAFAGNAIVIEAIDNARKNLFIEKPINIAGLTRLSFSAALATSTINYTNTVSDSRRAKAAAGRVTQRSSPMVATATAASAAVIDTATGAKPSRAAWTPHKSGRWIK